MVLTKTLVATIIAITIGSSFQFGFQIGVINNIFYEMKEFMCEIMKKRRQNFTCYDDNNHEKDYVTLIRSVSSLYQSIFPVGALFGTLTSGAISDKFGRKSGLLVLALPSLIGSIVMTAGKFINSFEAIIVGRFVIGYACGGYSCIAPTYLSEIAPLSIKGALGTVNQLAVVVAILVAQILGLEGVLGGKLWNYLLGLSLVPTLIQLIILPFCPDSPRFLMVSKRDESKTRKALSLLRSADFDEEIEDMRKDMLRNVHMTKLTLMDILSKPHLRLGLIIAIGMQVSQQFTGINAVMFYSTELFSKNLNLTTKYAQYASLGPSTVNIIITAVSVVIVDRAGRKTLHLIGLIGAIISLLIFIGCLFLQHTISAFGYVAVGAVCLFVASFAIGPGAIPWFMAAELFRENCRSTAVSAAAFTNWLCVILVGELYPELQKWLNHLSLLPFVILTFFLVVFTFIIVPETKGRSSAEVEDELKARVEHANRVSNEENSAETSPLIINSPTENDLD